MANTHKEKYISNTNNNENSASKKEKETLLNKKRHQIKVYSAGSSLFCQSAG